MNLVEQCLKAFQVKDLKDVGEIEQWLATGIDNAGKTITNQKLIAMIATRLAMGKMEPKDKLRLLLTACIAMELGEKDRKVFTQGMSIEDQTTLTKMMWLGVNPQKISSNKGKTNNKVGDVSEAAKKKMKNISFDLCRATPLIEQIATMVNSNQIDKTQYGSLFLPSTYDGSMAQKSKITAGQIMNLKKGAGKSYDNVDDKKIPKFIFFVIGGITHAEIRVLKEFESSNAYTNVIIGSTAIMKPQDYIEGISKMLSTTEYNEQKAKEPVTIDVK